MNNIEAVLKQENEKVHIKNLENIRDTLENFQTMKEEVEDLEYYYQDIKSNFRIPTFELNNKLIEINREFKNNNIHFYRKYRYIPDGIFAEAPGVNDSFVGVSILTYLTNRINNCVDYLDNYHNLLTNPSGVTNSKLILLLMRLTKKSIEEIIYTEADKEELKKYQQEYDKNDDAIFNYNLKDNLIDSIIITIKYYGLTANTVAVLMEDDIVPDLIKLGLADQIPRLKHNLITYYTQEIPKEYKIGAEEMFNYIPDFNRMKKLRATVIANPNLGLNYLYDALYSPSDVKIKEITK